MIYSLRIIEVVKINYLKTHANAVVNTRATMNPGSCQCAYSCISVSSPDRITKTETTGRQFTEFTYNIVIALAALAFGL